MDKSKVFKDLVFDIDPHDREPNPIRYELQLDQENFLYKLEDLWKYKNDPVFDSPYGDYMTTINRVLHKGWYDGEDQFELKEMIQLYKDDEHL